jgi:hypothetical protein
VRLTGQPKLDDRTSTGHGLSTRVRARGWRR